MTTKLTRFLSLLVLASLACQQPVGDQAAIPASEPGVEYEPAYPTDVSHEELSESDVLQQESHFHGESEEHSHGEEDHEHGEEEGHDGQRN